MLKKLFQDEFAYDEDKTIEILTGLNKYDIMLWQFAQELVRQRSETLGKSNPLLVRPSQSDVNEFVKFCERDRYVRSSQQFQYNSYGIYRSKGHKGPFKLPVNYSESHKPPR